MSDRVREIEARVEAATEGPWLFSSSGADAKNGVGTLMCGPGITRQERVRVANGEFIAHAREDVPWLLAELREARERADLLLNDAQILMDHHTSDELKMEARHRIIERHAEVPRG